MKNITIAMDEKTLAASRRYAREHHTSLNNLIRQLVDRTVTRADKPTWTKEFFALAERAKASSRGRRWKREDLYDA